MADDDQEGVPRVFGWAGRKRKTEMVTPFVSPHITDSFSAGAGELLDLTKAKKKSYQKKQLQI